MDRKEDGLKALGAKTQYRMDYAPEVLETFVNKHPGNDYWVRFNCPEFTSLCPITGQPDFAEIRISYIPDVKMGDEVTVFGPGGGDTADTIAAKTQTINYEIVCGLARRVPRVYKENGKICEIWNDLEET